jgi:hypothetical protein
MKLQQDDRKLFFRFWRMIEAVLSFSALGLFEEPLQFTDVEIDGCMMCGEPSVVVWRGRRGESCW